MEGQENLAQKTWDYGIDWWKKNSDRHLNEESGSCGLCMIFQWNWGITRRRLGSISMAACSRLDRSLARAFKSTLVFECPSIPGSSLKCLGKKQESDFAMGFMMYLCELLLARVNSAGELRGS
jgi:hypothetical protein